MNYIYYSLPKSVSEHKIIGKKDPNHAFGVLSDWLEKYTKYVIQKDVSLNLLVPIKDIDDTRFQVLESKLGKHKVWAEVRDYLAQKKTAEMWAYDYSYSKIKELLDLVNSNHSLLKEFSYSISYSIDFILKDYNGEVLKGQNLTGSIGKEKSNFFVHLSELSTISPSICFPFDYGQDFLQFYEYFTNHIPLKMNEKHLRTFVENQKTGRGVFKKLPTK